ARHQAGHVLDARPVDPVARDVVRAPAVPHRAVLPAVAERVDVGPGVRHHRHHVVGHVEGAGRRIGGEEGDLPGLVEHRVLRAVRAGGGTSSQIAPIFTGQRSWNAHPGPVAVKLPASVRRMRAAWRAAAGSGNGTAERSARVYGWCGGAKTSPAGPISHTRPRYITATRSAIARIMPRSWAMKRYVRPRRAWRSI